MTITRRNIFRSIAALFAAPAIARVLPIAMPASATASMEGGTHIQEALMYAPAMDELNHITTTYLEASSQALADSLFTQSPLMFYLNKRHHVESSGGVITGSFCKVPGEKWDRLHGGLHYPAKQPSLPV